MDRNTRIRVLEEIAAGNGPAAKEATRALEDMQEADIQESAKQDDEPL